MKEKEGREKRLPSSGGRSKSQLHSGKTQAEICLTILTRLGIFIPSRVFLVTSGAKWVQCAFKERSASPNFTLVVSHRLRREGKC